MIHNLFAIFLITIAGILTGYFGIYDFKPRRKNKYMPITYDDCFYLISQVALYEIKYYHLIVQGVKVTLELAWIDDTIHGALFVYRGIDNPEVFWFILRGNSKQYDMAHFIDKVFRIIQ